MTPFLASKISAKEIELFFRIRKKVWLLPDIQLGHDCAGKPIAMSCHILSRAVGSTFGLLVRNGYYADMYEHSWLTMPSGNILDVYPVGMVGGPVIVDTSTPLSPGRHLYRIATSEELSRCGPLRFDCPRLLRAAEATFEAMRQLG